MLSENNTVASGVCYAGEYPTSQPRAFDAFIDAARDVPEVIEIQTFLGRVDVRLSVVARDMADYQQVYRDRILTLPHIAEVEALMHVARIKTNAGVPI